MRWPWVRRSTFDATVDAFKDALGCQQQETRDWKEEWSEWRDKAIALDKENRELKSEIERLKSGIAAAINSLRPGEAE